MDIDPLAPLLQALALTPENVVLRAHVVKEALKSRRYKEVRELAEPLLSTEYRPLGLLATARAELLEGKAADAARHYKEAIIKQVPHRSIGSKSSSSMIGKSSSIGDRVASRESSERGGATSMISLVPSRKISASSPGSSSSRGIRTAWFLPLRKSLT